MPKRQKLNEALLTPEEKQMPIGLGLLAAAERLGLKYLDGPKPILELLVEYGNTALHLAKHHPGLSFKQFWTEMNEKADELATILKGNDPRYMATAWYTDPGQLRARLYRDLEKTRPNDPPNADWRNDPIRDYARSFMAFFVDLEEGAIEPPSTDPIEKQSADHLRKYAGAFLNMDPAMLSLHLAYNASGSKPADSAR